MPDERAFEEINDVKANMDHIYNRADPRAYFRELKRVGYTIPGAAKPVFQKLISHLRDKRDDTVCVLDLGCSYGINAALLKYDLSIDDLYDHWGKEKLAQSTPEEIVEDDKRYFANFDEAEDLEVIGLDVAENAVAFAEEAGLLDEGLAVDLECEPLPEAVEEELASVDLVISTGCIGYVTERSFNRLLPAVTKGQRPWFANFVLRMFPFFAIEQVLTEAGYVTERLKGKTFVQREFASAKEQEQVLEKLREQGIDPTGKESEGHLLAEFYLSRPKEDTARASINQLIV